MKKYLTPRTSKLSVDLPNNIMACSSYTGYPEPNPEMGTSASEGTPTMGTDAKRYWGI